MFFEGEISIVGTHDGKFHADEVMACAITSLLFENVQIIRSRDEDQLKNADIVFDVSKNDMVRVFNHHDRNWGEFRPNGIPFASAGAAWQLFGVEILKSMNISNQIHVDVFNLIDKIMAEIDAIDVGMNIDMKYGITPVISSFMPANGTEEEIEAAFNEALNFTKLYIIRQIKAFEHMELSKFQAWEVLKSNEKIAIFDKANPSWRDTINQHWNETSNIKLIVYPDMSGSWRVQSAPGENTLLGGNGFAIRCKAPEEWLGKNDFVDEFENNKFKIQFCHKGGFIGGAYSKDDAIKMAHAWIERSK